MSKRKKRYIRREKEEKFKSKIEGIKKERSSRISIDVSKDLSYGLDL